MTQFSFLVNWLNLYFYYWKPARLIFFVEISNILFAILMQPYLGLLILAGLPAWLVSLLAGFRGVFWSKPNFRFKHFYPCVDRSVFHRK